MKKIIILILILSMGLLVGCGDNDPFAQQPKLEIAISLDEATLEVGDVVRFASNIEYLTVEGELIWVSDNETIATVEDGIVVALAVGVATITASVDQYTTSVVITVVEKAVQYQIKIVGKQTLMIDNQVQLTAQLIPEATLSVHWSTNDATIATVTDTGRVSAIGVGLVTITATLDNDATVKSDYVLYIHNPEGVKDIIINEIIQTSHEIIGEFDLTQLNQIITTIVGEYKDAVVGVSNYQIPTGSTLLERSGIGSGVIYEKMEVVDGFTYTLLTNYHVIEDNDEVKVYLGYLDLEVAATVIRSDADLDLAIVQFTSPIDIEPMSFGQPETLHTGDFVIAIGNPTGYDYFGSVTFGMISYARRSMANEEALFIQHDAAINPGNSGGPLINMDGEVIGINTLKLASFDIDNMGFAISLETILEFLADES